LKYRFVVLTLSLLCGIPALAQSPRSPNAATAPPTAYVADFVSTAATGVAMNNTGDVAGTSYVDTGCGSFCLPPLETVVWRGGARIVLPTVPGLSGIYVRSINSQGWVAGFAGYPGTTTHAVVWKPNGNTYDAIDIGVLPGTTISDAMGIDDQGRVVGWSTTSSFPPNGSPFMWSESTGMIDLSAQGFPDEPALAISPGGTVATQFNWYRLDDPASVVSMPSPPQGFTIGAESTAINDAGDQARFLISTSTEHLRYLFRFHHEGTWQQISFTGNKNVLYSVGSITAARDVSATVLGTAMIAYGPDLLAQPLADLLSSAYKGAAVTTGGPMNSLGQILARVMIGNSSRLMRLTPAEPCVAGCIKVSALQIRGRFISDPNDPGHCTLNASNHVTVKLQLTNEAGRTVAGILVSGHFLDDYWMNKPVSGITNAQGAVSFVHDGLACVGAVAVLVDNATKGTRVLDRTTGVVTGSVIPLP
jgi:probable HAF family extracellular repeat protein